MSKFKIYTKSGDGGESSLFNGTRGRKDGKFFEALGNVDELNSAVGLAREHCRSIDQNVADKLEVIQSRLLDVGSAVATPKSTSNEAKLNRVKFDESSSALLESWIDELDEQLPPLSQFILPSGGLAASHLHMARTICRRAERSVVPLIAEDEMEGVVGVFLNRLSDYLFTAARLVAKKSGHPEVTYKKA